MKATIEKTFGFEAWWIPGLGVKRHVGTVGVFWMFDLLFFRVKLWIEKREKS